MASIDSFNAKSPLQVGGKSYEIYRLDALAQAGLDVASLPYSLKILLENLLRTENGTDITDDDIQALANWDANRSEEHTSELQSLMRNTYAVFYLKKNNNKKKTNIFQK